MKKAKQSRAGVSGKLLSGVPSGINFESGRKPSHYEGLLIQLKTAPPGSILQFQSLACRASISARAKKMGIKVSFAERDTSLFVRYDGIANGDHVNGNHEDHPKRRTPVLPSSPTKYATPGTPGEHVTIGKRVLSALAAGPRSAIELSEDLELRPNQIYPVTAKLKEDGAVESRNDDTDGTRRWFLTR